MLRLFFGNLTRAVATVTTRNSISPIQRSLSSVVGNGHFPLLSNLKPIQNYWTNTSIAVGPSNYVPPSSIVQHQPVRSLTKFSLKKGKRKSVKAVIKRFKRLDWGIWIRTHCGRNKKLFKKSPALKRRLRQHVFTNSTQSWLLDSMVTNFWRKPKYYIDDPYEPYHKRDEYFATKSKTLKI